MHLLTQLITMVVAVAVAVAADTITPKVMIVSMFAPEAQAWYHKFEHCGLGNLSAIDITTRGLSMLFPSISCTQDASVCHVTVGEGEINAAASAMALLLSPAFDLRKTYFLLGGIAGVNPHRATLGSVAFARYAVQVGLQYEVDPRSAPDDWDTGYISYGSDRPHQYPSVVYGSEVFELNAKLRDAAYELASTATLDDADNARALGAQYAAGSAAAPPGLVKCDVTTSDVYFVGDKLAQEFDATTEIWTNGTGAYCMSAQEDNAILEVLVRGAADRLVDFSRIVLLRAGANFDRPPPGVPIRDFMAEAAAQPGQAIAAQNMYSAGVQVVRGIVRGWDETFARGLAPDNYVGDMLGSLGGEPDFGTPGVRLDAQRRLVTAGSNRQARRRVRMQSQEHVEARRQERQKEANLARA
ncbi:purine nucleoside permease [Beauveria bassiana ARSEF 2860]|uniref:Purine nucleoside permease n=1 Tax=Beauveria bassiana (strain ARSEF 2860) TaxID=655819 RepID=J4UX00_BEAB2|nr:purine nucleoside permease [Beauveria bassiana ARSEF 2860]EJP70917.1 purine nucleoside permease [Beauveria bassiana ARSEF 2860]